MNAHQPRFPLKPTLLSLLLAFPAHQALAATCTWNPASGNWNVGANWSCGFVPTGGPDAAIIAGGKTVTVDTAQSILNLTNSGNVNIDAFLLTLQSGGGTTNTGIINVGSGVTAALQVSAGHNINNAGGTINIANGSVLNQFGSSISGGTITTTGSGKVVAFNNTNNFLTGVALNGNLDLATGTGIERISGGLTLNGTINIGSGSVLAPQGDQTIGGTGNIVFADNNGSNRLNVEAGNLILGSNITVRGNTGYIGQQAFVGGPASLTNNGTIAADVAGGTITLAVNGTVTNNGTLSASNGGTLVLNNSIIGNTGSQITVGTGSTILQNGVTLNGVITNAGTGSFRASNSGNNFLNAAIFTGNLDLATGAGSERISGGLTLNGTINIGSGSVLAPQGDQTIGGTGNIVFADNNGSNRLNVEAGNLILGSNITVRGNTGYIGQQAYVGGAASLTNNGTIAADVAGGTITLAVNGTVTNNATLSASNGGTLVLNSNIIGNTGSQILAGAGSVVNQNGVAISGDMNLTGPGSFRASNNGNNILSGVTLSGTLDLASATGIERVAGGLTLNGATVNIGNNSVLAPQGDQTIGGTGNIVFADSNGSNRLNVEAGNLTLGPGITVRGQTGIIGQQSFVGGAASLTNNGTIAADVAGGSITLQVSGLTTNNGTLSASNGGTLNLNSAVTGNTGSQILAGAGSVVNQNGVTISGDMNLTGPGSFRASNNGNNFLSGVTLSGTLDLASATGIERVAGGLTLNGATVNIGNNSVLAPQGDQTIGGTGNIVFADSNGSNRLNVEAGNLTLGPGITVRGQTGIIGQQSFVGGAATLTNKGLISADVAGRSITLGVSGQVINQATMEARDGGQLILTAGGGYDNSAGVLLANTGSSVLLNSAVVTGGVLNSSGSGRFIATNSGGNFLNGTTLNGVLDMASATGIERISAGGMTLNGTINIGNGSTLAPQGNQTIGGTGSIVFADAGGNRLNVEAGNLVIGSGVTVRGQTGIIGQQSFVGGAASLTNNGTINADAAGTITVAVSGAVTNNGTMRAQNGTLTIQNGLTGTGTLQIDSTGVMNLANTPNTQGRLVMGTSGSTLNIGTQNLTINTDYTNAAAGSGNGFNRRAGVTGAGLIVAGGDATQTITGTNVTNGSTANATLTIGNVRVGATTFNYQIANTGSTGPALRGAIQTAANGGNLTDTRLSGSGVTASNYNTGAPGSNTGNLGVTMTVASAGALAPLSGQVLNLRSNFDNIADQKLNIVLGAGAAAYNAAIGNASSPVVIANQRVGGSNTATVSITNAAAAGSFSEDLNASIGGTSGAVSGSGSITGRLAGASSGGGAITVGVNAASAGAKTGTVTLNYETAGTVAGVANGLGTASVGNQNVTVNGNVYRLAQGSAAPTPINFGSRHVGDAVSQVLAVQNTAASDGFSEKLNASFGSNTGAATNNGGNIALLAAGGSNNSAMVIGLNTASAGAKTGSVTLNYVSDGAGTSGLSAIAAGSDTVNVSGNVYRLASANTLGAINFGNVHVGDTVQQALSISNTAIGDGFSEKLNASFGASSDARITASGSISQLAAGSSNNASMIVGLNTAAAGLVNGTQVVNFASDGAGTSGLGVTALPSQTIGVSGDITTSGSVFRLASASPATPNPVSFGNVRIGTATDQALSITNTAANDGFSEKLNASISSNGAPVTANGTFNLLAAQSTNSTSLHVGIDTSSAGVKSGSAVIALVSDGTDTSGLGTTALASQTVNVSGTVYRLANAQGVTPNVTLVARVGDAAPTGNVSITNQSPDTFTEALKVQAGAAPSGFTVGANPANIAAQSTGIVQVGLNTATAGISTGSLALNHVSTGEGTTNAADIGVGSSNVALTGKVYTQATGQLVTPTVDFGIVRVGDIVSANNMTVRNTAAATALNDTLRANLSGVGGPFSSGSTVGGVAAQSLGNIAVGLNTGAAGIFTQNGTVSFLSQNPDMADVSAGANSTVQIKAQVNNLANADYQLLSAFGLLTKSGSNYLLDLGDVTLDHGPYALTLHLGNNVSGPADRLSGLFDTSGVNDFSLTGWGPIGSLAAGQSSDDLGIGFLASSLGLFQDEIEFSGFSSNDSDPTGRAQSRHLVIRAHVIDRGSAVPEPGTLVLLLLSLAGMVLQRRRAMLH